MLTHSINCPDCKKPVDYWRVHCRCGYFLGFPNRRQAEAERTELMTRYEAAHADAAARRVSTLLAGLERLADQSLPVINMSFAACDDIVRPGKYRNYDQRVESGERDPASALDHGDREIVGGRLFPTYKHNIQYAALSPNGRGLESGYGPVAVRWQVTREYLGRRSSLTEENSYTFFGKYSLGGINASVPLGYQSVWEDRAKLAAAKLASRLTSATGQNDLPGLLLHEGPSRQQDEFIEIAIYAEEGLDTQDVDMVTVQRRPATSEEGYRRDIVREACASRGISFVE
jgi:hypothetical protein